MFRGTAIVGGKGNDDNKSMDVFQVLDNVMLHIEKYQMNLFKLGFSMDGIQAVHDPLRCGSYDKVMEGIALYKSINGNYPSMNCTVGREVLAHAEETISFFQQFHHRITFSRMIGRYGISREEFHKFM